MSIYATEQFVYVKTLTGRIHKINVQPSDTIRILRSRVQALEGPTLFSLIYAGRYIDNDDQTLLHYRIKNESTIQMVDALRMKEARGRGVEFVIPKGTTPVGFTVEVCPSNLKGCLMRAKVFVDDVQVIDWEDNAAQQEHVQVAHNTFERQKDRTCRVLIETNNTEAEWKAAPTRYSQFNMPPKSAHGGFSGSTQGGYVLHAISATESANVNCIVHVVYMTNEEKPVSLVAPTLAIGVQISVSISLVVDALLKGSESVRIQTAQNFLTFVEQSSPDLFSDPQIVVSIIDAIYSCSERVKTTIMFALGKILMHNSSMAYYIVPHINIVLDLLKDTNPNLLPLVTDTLWMFAFDDTLAIQLKDPSVVALLNQLEAATTNVVIKKSIRGILLQLGLLIFVKPNLCVAPCTHCQVTHPTRAEPLLASFSNINAPEEGVLLKPSRDSSNPSSSSSASSSTTTSTTTSASQPNQTAPDASFYPSALSVTMPTLKHGEYVMLSYNWGNQALVKRIKQALTDFGYNVWIDVERMQGSTLEAMALAVEQSALVLVCFSKKYKESAACRTEAEYAYTKRKPIIPLKLEKDYTADGWLGALLGSKLYYEFTNPDSNDFHSTLMHLMRELGQCGKYM